MHVHIDVHVHFVIVMMCFMSSFHTGPGIKPAEERNIEFLEEVAVGVARSEEQIHVHVHVHVCTLCTWIIH